MALAATAVRIAPRTLPDRGQATNDERKSPLAWPFILIWVLMLGLPRADPPEPKGHSAMLILRPSLFAAAVAAVIVTAPWPPAFAGDVGGGCTRNGILLHGKVKVVTTFADLKVQVVSSFQDLKVQRVGGAPNHCGQWQWVDSFPDFTVQFVDSFADLKITWVDAFPGRP